MHLKTLKAFYFWILYQKSSHFKVEETNVGLEITSVNESVNILIKSDQVRVRCLWQCRNLEFSRATIGVAILCAICATNEVSWSHDCLCIWSLLDRSLHVENYEVVDSA